MKMNDLIFCFDKFMNMNINLMFVCTSQIFLITDLLFGYLRREYALEMGPKPKLENGEVGQVTLD